MLLPALVHVSKHLEPVAEHEKDAVAICHCARGAAMDGHWRNHQRRGGRRRALHRSLQQRIAREQMTALLGDDACVHQCTARCPQLLHIQEYAQGHATRRPEEVEVQSLGRLSAVSDSARRRTRSAVLAARDCPSATICMHILHPTTRLR
jgi:hypothetical protein